MGDTNYFSSIVKVLENPQPIISEDKIPVTRFRAELQQIRKNKILHLVFWGNLANNIKAYYQVNDYILIEGYLSVQDKKSINSVHKKLKKIEISVLKVYPFLLKSYR